MKVTIERLGWGRGYLIRMTLSHDRAREYVVPDTYTALHVIRTLLDGDEWQGELARLERAERAGT